MPPMKSALRFMSRWWAVIVAAIFGPVTSMYCTASRVVMCSSTTLSRGKRAQDAFAVLERLLRRANGGLQVGHHDGTRETPRAVGEHRGHGGPVTQVQMPVVRAPQREPVHRPNSTWRARAPCGT